MKHLPVYVKCHFSEGENKNVINVYKIDRSDVRAHPFQLFRRAENNNWENLSVYATVNDAVMVLLKELFSADLEDEVNHGQATINTGAILAKINDGDQTVTIFGSSNNAMFRLNVDVNFENLVDRNEPIRIWSIGMNR